MSNRSTIESISSLLGGFSRGFSRREQQQAEENLSKRRIKLLEEQQAYEQGLHEWEKTHKAKMDDLDMQVQAAKLANEAQMNAPVTPAIQGPLMPGQAREYQPFNFNIGGNDISASGTLQSLKTLSPIINSQQTQEGQNIRNQEDNAAAATHQQNILDNPQAFGHYPPQPKGSARDEAIRSFINDSIKADETDTEDQVRHKISLAVNLYDTLSKAGLDEKVANDPVDTFLKGYTTKKEVQDALLEAAIKHPDISGILNKPENIKKLKLRLKGLK